MKNRFLELFQTTESESPLSLTRSRLSLGATKGDLCPQMSEVEVSADDFVLDILNFFFSQERLSSNQLNDELRQVAATMLWEAIQDSKRMDLVPRPPGGAPSITWLVSQAVQIAFRRANNQCVYVAVRNSVARNFKSAYDVAKQTGGAQSISSSLSTINYVLQGIIPVLAQPKTNACWATVFTMMYSWKRQQSMDIETALGNIGQRWVDIYRNDTGLSRNDKPAFVSDTGLVAEPPMSVSVQGWENMLRQYGPIWVTTSESADAVQVFVHARIIKGIRGDGSSEGTRLMLIDPFGGREYEESIAVFFPKFEEEVIRTGYTRIQVIHWPGNLHSAPQSVEKMSHSEIKSLIQSAQFSDIPLDPSTGGRSIGLESLETGDIILSTTSHAISAAIRKLTSAPISHSILYIGDGMIVEAVGSGVRMVPLDTALQGATSAIALRYPNLSHASAMLIRDFAVQQIGRSYDRWGIVSQASFQIDRKTICERFSDPSRRQKCINFLGRVNLGTETNDSFFCSELVIAAYQHAGVPLTTTPPHWNTPGDIAELLFTRCAYVGHLIS